MKFPKVLFNRGKDENRNKIPNTPGARFGQGVCDQTPGPQILKITFFLHIPSK